MLESQDTSQRKGNYFMQYSNEMSQEKDSLQVYQELQLELLRHFPDVNRQFLQDIVYHVENGTISVSCARIVLRNLQQLR